MRIPRTTDDPYIVEAVLRALDVLEVFNGSTELSLHEISQRTGLNKSRCFRLLHTLASRKYVERTAEGLRYRLGSRPFDHATGTRRDVREIAHPHLVRLRDQFNETVNLGVIYNGEVLYIDLVESQRPFRMSAMIGSRMPIASTAMGKAILARLAKESTPELLADRSIPRSLLDELKGICVCGYALDNEENEPGVACIGASIQDANNIPIAAISVSGPVRRILTREQEIARGLRLACQRISEQLGLQASSLATPGRRRGAKQAPAGITSI